MLPADGHGMAAVRRAALGGRRPQFEFMLEEENGRRVRLALGSVDDEGDRPPSREDSGRARARESSAFEEKIIDYLRQTAEWDPRVATSENPRGDEPVRANRLLPFEFRARRQYRDSPERPRRPKR